MSGKWRSVTVKDPCPICSKADWCAWSYDHNVIKCERSTEAPSGWIRFKDSGNGGLFKRGANKKSKSVMLVNWASEAEKCKDALTSERRKKLALELGVSADGLTKIGIGWATSAQLDAWGASGEDWKYDRPNGAFTFPEHSGEGKVVGVSLRAEDGRKGAPSGKKTESKRGLVYSAALAKLADPVLIVEGATDVAALETLGLAAVGRPSNTGGVKDLAHLLRGRDVIVVGERDQKEDGSWPGRDGADKTAGRLATSWKRSVLSALPPEGSKDVRDWLRSRELDLSNAEACAAAGLELLTALRAGAQTAEAQEEPSQAELLVQLAMETYRIGCSEEGEAFAVEEGGPNIALMFDSSRHALRAALARDFRRRHNKTPNSAALADALTVLEGEAQEVDREPVYLRIAPYQGGIVLDLGNKDGTAIIVGPAGRQFALRSPVLFRRSALIGELPVPQSDGSILALRELVNVTERTWQLALGWLVAGFISNVPHPLLMLGGLHGTGKSTAARMLIGILDPSPVPLRSPPNDDRNWAVACSASYAMVMDNVSSISAWWSDALCKCVTGDGYPFRKLYTNSEITVLAFRRVVALTSIDAGALRGDLGDRLLLIDLEAIEDAQRLTERELDERYAASRPMILGAVLDLVGRVIAELPNVTLDSMPRLADFACVLAAMDKVLGTDSLKEYLGQRERIAAEVIDSDPIGAPIVALMDASDRWQGTASELLKAIKPDEKNLRGWPTQPRSLSGRVKRLIPALLAVGVRVDMGARRAGGKRERLIEITHVVSEGGGTVGGTVRDDSPGADRPAKNGLGDPVEANRDDRDDRDGAVETPNEEPPDFLYDGPQDDDLPSSDTTVAPEPSRPSQPSQNGPGELETRFSAGRSRDGRDANEMVDRPGPDDVIEPVEPPRTCEKQTEFIEDPGEWED